MLSARSTKFPVFIAALTAAIVLFGLRWSFPRSDNLMDFGAFVAAGRAAVQGVDPYAVLPLATPTRLGEEYWINLNPPIALLAFQVLAQFDPLVAFRGWYFMSLSLFALALALLVLTYRAADTPLRIPWALGLSGLWVTLNGGQIYTPMLLATAATWILLRSRRYLLAGSIIGGLIAIKPNLLILLAMLFVAGHRGVAMMAFVSTALLSAIPLLAFGPEVYNSWLKVLPTHAVVIGSENGSLVSIMAPLGLPWASTALVVTLLVGPTILVWRRRPPVVSASAIGLTVALLASPVNWIGYSVILLPVFFERPWTLPIKVAAVLLMMPIYVNWLLHHISPTYYVPTGLIYGMGLLLLLAALIKETLPQAKQE